MTLEGQYRGVKLDALRWLDMWHCITTAFTHATVMQPNYPQDTQIGKFSKGPKKNLGYFFDPNWHNLMNGFWYYFEHILQKSVDLLL